MLSSRAALHRSGSTNGWPSTSAMKAPRARARSTSAMSSGASPCRGGATRSLKIRGELTIAACSGWASGTRITSMRKSAVFGSSSSGAPEQPGNSSAGRTGAEPET